MKSPGAKYRRKRNLGLIIYLLISAGSFLLGTGLMALWETLDWGILYSIAMVLIMVCSLTLIALIPVAIWAVNLSLKAKKEDRLYIQRQQPQPVKELVDAAGDRIKIVRRPPPYPYAGFEDKGPFWACIFMLFLLPPVGMCFVLYKLYQEPQHAPDNVITVRSTGWVLLALAALLAAGIIALGASEGEQLIALMVFLPGMMAVCAAILLAAAAQVDKNTCRLARLHSLIFVDATLSIDGIAKQMGMTYGKTVRLLQSHIDRGELFSCFLDFEQRQIVAPDQLPRTATKCRHCGGSTVHIKDVPALCRYCGRVLK